MQQVEGSGETAQPDQHGQRFFSRRDQRVVPDVAGVCRDVFGMLQRAARDEMSRNGCGKKQQQTDVIGTQMDGHGDSLTDYLMMPPPRQISPSYTTTDCPGVTAH